MDDLKQARRKTQDEIAERQRDVDGHDVTDDLGNAGDRIRTGVGDAGDKLREVDDDLKRDADLDRDPYVRGTPRTGS